ncbi:MAG TPA: DUF4190 domain-containing protein [Microbacterium sp.]|nr:DUF4190 domain-containing protein [Microbacterium sp.]
MTDPQNPDVPARPPEYDQPPAYDTTPPPAAAQPGYPQQQGYAQPAYSTAPPPPYGSPSAAPTFPGKTMGIVAFIVSLAGLVVWVLAPLVGLILGIIALVQSKKAGHKNGFALAAIIISAVLIVIGIILSIAIFGVLIAAGTEFARLCAEYGTGVHEINGVNVTLDCG